MSDPYVVVRYPGKPFFQTHPDRLSTAAALFGLETESIYNARVLEVGCCDGGNLIPMAMSLPGSRFVGIDLTERDILDARETACALGVTNVEFHAFDLTNLPGPFGAFDFVICHGVYSWVPTEVREKLLPAVRLCLNPRGVAYVSYNALPAGHLRAMIREMTMFHCRETEEPLARIAKAREFFAFLKPAWEHSEQPAILLREVERMIEKPDYAFFHDEFDPNFHPVSISAFMADAERDELQYLSEVNYFMTRPEFLGSGNSDLFAQASAGMDPEPKSQYLDFLTGSFFHQTLLCHRNIKLDRQVNPARLKGLSFASPAEAESLEPGSESFFGPGRLKITTTSPFLRRLMHALIDVYPRAIHFEDLPGAESDADDLSALLLKLMDTGIIAPCIQRAEFCGIPGDHPVASPIARRQASSGDRSLTDLRHFVADVSDNLEFALVPLLDGTRDRADLLRQLPAALLPGEAPEKLEKLDQALRSLGLKCLLLS